MMQLLDQIANLDLLFVCVLGSFLVPLLVVENTAKNLDFSKEKV